MRYVQFSLQTRHPAPQDLRVHVLSGQGGMLLACSAILRLISLGQHLRIGIMDSYNGSGHTPIDLTENTHMVTVSALSKVTHGLASDWQMACLNQAHLLSTSQNQKKIRSPQLHQAVPVTAWSSSIRSAVAALVCCQ